MLRAALFDQPLSVEDTWRNNRIQLALKLHKLPGEIDSMPYTDYLDLMSIIDVNTTQDRRAAHR